MGIDRIGLSKSQYQTALEWSEKERLEIQKRDQLIIGIPSESFSKSLLQKIPLICIPLQVNGFTLQHDSSSCKNVIRFALIVDDHDGGLRPINQVLRMFGHEAETDTEAVAIQHKGRVAGMRKTVLTVGGEHETLFGVNECFGIGGIQNVPF